jgi:hypothetical protein
MYDNMYVCVCIYTYLYTYMYVYTMSSFSPCGFFVLSTSGRLEHRLHDMSLVYGAVWERAFYLWPVGEQLGDMFFV